MSLNTVIIGSFGVPNAQIAAIDCSFIPKSGDKTFGLDQYWSGSTGHTEKGLEISALAIIDISSGRAWNLDVVQTPAHLNRVEDLPQGLQTSGKSGKKTGHRRSIHPN